MNSTEILDCVKEYYGEHLKSSDDLKTDACKMQTDMSAELKAAEKYVPEEVRRTYYGCGLVAPARLRGRRIVDLGCGTGRDCYMLAQLVGAGGEVVGVDMTLQSLQVARRNLDDFYSALGSEDVAKISFVQGCLDNLPLEGPFDVAISNCVVNLCPDKEAVFRECFRVLGEGGEFYFSDIFCNKPVPEEAKKDKILWGDCLSGALVWQELAVVVTKAGFQMPPMVVEAREVTPGPGLLPEALSLLQDVRFAAVGVRLFRHDDNGTAAAPNRRMVRCLESLTLHRTADFQAGRIYDLGTRLADLLCRSSRFGSIFNDLGSVPGNDDNGGCYGRIEDTYINPFDVLDSGTKQSGCQGNKKCC